MLRASDEGKDETRCVVACKTQPAIGRTSATARTSQSSKKGPFTPARWKGRDGTIYEWDFQHGAVEKYNKRGKHLGEFDHETGTQNKAADPTRMKHVIMGVPEGEDFASFEKEIPASVADLKLIMGWEKDDDYVYDYPLTSKQISAIEQLCSLELPRDLELFLTCNA